MPPAGTKRKILPRIDGPTRDFEIMIALAEIEPGFHAPRHIHPGNESASIVAGVAARTPHLLQNGAKPTRIVSTCVL
jgi:quercetin dioxygenase-like cupin family protein